MIKKKKKNLLKSRFYQVYFSLLALALLLIVIGTVWFTNYLRDVETAAPVYAAEDVVKLFEAGAYDRIFNLDTSASQFAEEDRAFYVQSMHEYTDGKQVDFNETWSQGENQHRYNVTLDGTKFASFTLVPSGLTTPMGRTLWTLGSITTNVTLEDNGRHDEAATTVAAETSAEPEAGGLECRITAPKDCTVTVDGVNLDADNSQIAEKPLYKDGFLPENVTAPMLLEYTYRAKTDAPQVLVTDASGASLQAAHNDAATWTVPLPEDTTVKNQMSEAVISMAKRIAKFTSRDASQGSVLQHCAANSPARNIFSNLSNTFATPHTAAKFENEQVTEFHMLSEDCFTCRISFDYLLNTAKGVRTENTAYTFCVVKQGGTGKLYNVIMG